MQYAHIPTNWTMFYDGNNLAGEASSMELPKIEPEFETTRYAGHFGQVPHNIGLKELKSSWEILNPNRGLGDVGNLNNNSTTVIAKASTTTNSGPETICVKAIMTGAISSHEIGKNESGKVNPAKFEMILVRFVYYIDGVEEYYIVLAGDTPSFRVRGKEMWGAQVGCLGL